MYALNARTELLAAGGVVHRGECSTLVRIGTDETVPPISAQTWDWHHELTTAWLLIQHENTDLPFITLTERGVVGKIGLNAAGVGVHVNILSHVSDAPQDGDDVVPVHADARRILDPAQDVAQANSSSAAQDWAHSTCFTILDPRRARCLEAAPCGVAPDLRPMAGSSTPTTSWTRTCARATNRWTQRQRPCAVIECFRNGSPATPKRWMGTRWRPCFLRTPRPKVLRSVVTRT